MLPCHSRGCDQKPSPRNMARRFALLAVTALPLCLGGCKSIALGDITGSIGRPDTALPTAPDDVRRYTQAWEKQYDARPNDKATVMAFARGLRAQGQYAQAVAILQKLALKNPEDLEVLGAYGKALADAGRLPEAAEALKHAQLPEKPNWSVLSAQGSVADQMGDPASAQAFYREALLLNPGEPAILSNLGLSLALTKQLDQAEAILRQASTNPRADARVRQNLALVLALQGKFTEAEEVSARDLPPEQAAANVTAIRQMIAQSNTWREIRNADAPKARPAPSARTHNAAAAAPEADPAAAWMRAANASVATR